MTPTAVDQILAGQQPAKGPATSTPSAIDLLRDDKRDPKAEPLTEEAGGKSPWRQLTPEEVAALASRPGASEAWRMFATAPPTKDVPTTTEMAGADPKFPFLSGLSFAAAKAAPPPSRFWQAVTWDLHLTASGLIIFACLAIARFWPSQRGNFQYVVGLAATYLIGNTTGKTLPTKE